MNKHRGDEHLGDPRSKAGAWRCCAGLSKAVLVIISFLAVWLWASFTWPNTMFWFHDSPFLAEEMNAVCCYSSESARAGLGLHQAAAQAGWGWLPAANWTRVCNAVWPLCHSTPCHLGACGRGSGRQGCLWRFLHTVSSQVWRHSLSRVLEGSYPTHPAIRRAHLHLVPEGSHSLLFLWNKTCNFPQ